MLTIKSKRNNWLFGGPNGATFLAVDSCFVVHDQSMHHHFILRRVWRYQKGNQKPYIEEEQTTQWPKEKEQKDKQWSTKHTYKTNDRVTRTPLKPGGELRCSGREAVPASINNLFSPWYGQVFAQSAVDYNRSLISMYVNFRL